jgi:Protein of unknown function (DUF1549)/Protein of unknown function (DUF1553)
MNRTRLCLVLFYICSWGQSSISAAAEPTSSADELAAQIDKLVLARWRQAQVQPSARSSDAEFIRRIYLDVTGSIPPVAEVRTFLADPSPSKRRQLIERLLGGPGFVSHSAANWRRLIAPDAENDPNRQAASIALEKWLQKQFAANVGLDRIVRSILTWPLDENNLEGADPAAPSPRLFYFGRTGKPDELAAATTRLFLGVRLECAQCHNHPFASWSREQFWSQAAFFTGLEKTDKDARWIEIPGTSQKARARFLDGSEPPGTGDVRPFLADWVVAPTNPFFGRAAVNRVWEQFFGIGLVDPVDDLTAENKPSHPELLEALARAFVENGYDLKLIVRAVLLTNVYQLSSLPVDSAEPGEPRLFSRMNVKALTPEQAFDSLLAATAYRGRDLQALRGRFLARMTRGEQRLDGQASIPQVLAMMNGELLQSALRTEGDNTLAAVAGSPFLDAGGKIEALYLAALARPPRPAEKARCAEYVQVGRVNGKGDNALADVFWALLNSAEFLHNH